MTKLTELVGGDVVACAECKDVSNNGLESLPDCITDLPELRELNLSRNTLDKLPTGASQRRPR